MIPSFLRRLGLATAMFLVPAIATAQSLSGRLVSPTGTPIAGVQVDPGRGSTPVTSDAAGLFTVVGLQNRSYDVEYRPSLGLPWCGRLIVTNISGATNVGDVVLQPGLALSGIARTQAGAPVFGGNVNVYDGAGTKLYTPFDGTDVNGNFSVMVPAGTWRVRIVPPTGAALVPWQRDGVVVQAATNLGITTLKTGYVVTGSVVDQVTSVPIGNVRIQAFDASTNEEIVLPTDTTNTFGAFSLLLPFALVNLEFDPPVGNTHVGRQLFDVVVIAPLALGQVRLQNGVFLSGTVTGPNGAVASADIDVLALDGHKIYTQHDFTAANGTFAVAVPNSTSYRVRVEPRAGSGLLGALSAPIAVAGATSAGTITLVGGVTVSGTISGPMGPEANANLNFYDAANGTELITAGDHTDANGSFSTTVPTGTWNVLVDPAEGSFGAPLQVNGVAIAGPTTFSRTLAAKQLRLTVSSYGIPTLPQGGPLPIDALIHNLTPGNVAALIDIVVQLPSGAEIPVFPTIPLDVPPVQLPLLGILFPLPAIPASETGKLLKFVVRFRAAGNGAVLDSASTEFVVQ